MGSDGRIPTRLPRPARRSAVRNRALPRRKPAPQRQPERRPPLSRRRRPAIYDPFVVGGTIPLEAQRLGLRAVASDLNPVAVLINKALIEIPPQFAAQPPVNPDADKLGMKTGKIIGKGKNRCPETVPWRGAAGLADGIRYYGRRMREMTLDRIGHLYPKAKLPDGSEATIIAWLRARTVLCHNPTRAADMPLMKTFHLSRSRTTATG